MEQLPYLACQLERHISQARCGQRAVHLCPAARLEGAAGPGHSGADRQPAPGLRRLSLTHPGLPHAHSRQAVEERYWAHPPDLVSGTGSAV